MSGRPFVVHVARLRRVRGTRWHEIRSGVVEDLAGLASSVPEGAEVQADVTLESIAGGISVAGVVSAPWVGECRRCLDPSSGTLRIKVLEHYTEAGDGSDTYPLVDDEIDLEPMVHDAVVLELPLAPLCRPDCQGLCPSCGANRNEEDCGCETREIDPRWAALGALRLTESAGGGEASKEKEESPKKVTG